MDSNNQLYDACRNGNKQLVLSLIKEELDWNYGLSYACMGGHRDIIDLMINKGANNFNIAFISAFYNGNKELINLILEKGIYSYAARDPPEILDFNSGLAHACYLGNEYLVDLMISGGANDFNRGLFNARRKKHDKIAELMIKKGAIEESYEGNNKINIVGITGDFTSISNTTNISINTTIKIENMN